MNEPLRATFRASSSSQSHSSKRLQRKKALKMIVLMGYIHVEPSDVPDFLVDFAAIAAGTRAERGCFLCCCYGRCILWMHVASAAMA